ncbi:hypothetical protein VNO78_12401 [Psophocarpus tetragonolobus]|uniref:Uncharacterized protein n=1 Tax=Psophocarpus tetragonolobus TaxID=3891 RepID=A0AAN9SPU2_PSOTE
MEESSYTNLSTCHLLSSALDSPCENLNQRTAELLTKLVNYQGKPQMDLEEAQGQEIEKLQNTFQEVQTQLDEAYVAFIHGREATKIEIEQPPPVIKEVPIVDNTMLEFLTNKNEELEAIF